MLLLAKEKYVWAVTNKHSANGKRRRALGHHTILYVNVWLVVAEIYAPGLTVVRSKCYVKCHHHNQETKAPVHHTRQYK